MDGPPVCRGGSPAIWRSLVAALILVALVIATVFLATVRQRGKGAVAGTLDAGRWTGANRPRRDTGEITEIAANELKPTTLAPGLRTSPLVSDLLPDKSGDYFPVGGRSTDWDSDQMSTDDFDVQSKTDFIDEEDYDYEPESLEEEHDYDYADDEERGRETSKSNAADAQADNLEELIGENGNSSLPRGKEFADYSDFDDGQKFDEDEYETTFIKPGMHYGDNVEVVEQVTTLLCCAFIHSAIYICSFLVFHFAYI